MWEKDVDGMEIKVATFNLKHDYISVLKNHWNNRRDSIREFFLKYAPDIVGTQELTGSRIVELLALARNYDFIGEGRGGGAKGEYTAIFYRKDKFKCLASSTFWLSRKPETAGTRDWLALNPRICTWGLFEEEEGARFYCFNTHLPPISLPARKKSIELISGEIRRIAGGAPVFLTGDLNAAPKSSTLEVLSNMNVQYGLFTTDSYSAFVQGEPHAQKTYHGFRGKTEGNPLDYIFASEDIAVNKVDIIREKLAGTYPSDHYPVIMEAEIVANGK